MARRWRAGPGRRRGRARFSPRPRTGGASLPAKKSWFDATSEREVEFLQGIVVAVRNLRVESKISPGKLVPVVVRGERAQLDRSEERRVGKECRSRWSPY